MEAGLGRAWRWGWEERGHAEGLAWPRQDTERRRGLSGAGRVWKRRSSEGGTQLGPWGLFLRIKLNWNHPGDRETPRRVKSRRRDVAGLSETIAAGAGRGGRVLVGEPPGRRGLSVGVAGGAGPRGRAYREAGLICGRGSCLGLPGCWRVRAAALRSAPSPCACPRGFPRRPGG